jgi:hypothetical protein
MLESARIVVVNATPIISLALIDQLDLLRQLYDEIIIPNAIYDEVLAGGSSGIGIIELERSDWIRVVALKDPSRAELLLFELDRGEAEVIALAQEKNADLVIVDERLARSHARRLGLTLTGTLGVLLRAKQNQLIPEVKPLIMELQRAGIYLGKDLVIETLRLAGESVD